MWATRRLDHCFGSSSVSCTTCAGVAVAAERQWLSPLDAGARQASAVTAAAGLRIPGGRFPVSAPDPFIVKLLWLGSYVNTTFAGSNVSIDVEITQITSIHNDNEG